MGIPRIITTLMAVRASICNIWTVKDAGPAGMPGKMEGETNVDANMEWYGQKCWGCEARR